MFGNAGLGAHTLGTGVQRTNPSFCAAQGWRGIGCENGSICLIAMGISERHLGTLRFTAPLPPPQPPVHVSVLMGDGLRQ